MESGSRDGVHDPVLNDDPIDLGTEPEVLRWLTAYALADPAERDGTVGDVLTEVNLLLRRYRLRDAHPAAAYEAHARVLVDQMPAVLWSTDAELRVTSLAGGGLAATPAARPA